MRDAVHSESARPRSNQGQAAWMSKARRRAVRQHLALATEQQNVFSVALYGAVWTLYRAEMQQPKLESATKSKGTTVATPRRSEKRAQRQKDHQARVQAALRLRLAHSFRRWKQIPHHQQALLMQTSSTSSLDPPLPPQPMAQQDTATRAPSQQHMEHMDAGGRPKSGRSAPSEGDSPSTPRAKRTLLLPPPGPPPPSLPPSPPSPNGGKQPPGPSGPKQNRAGVCGSGRTAATDVRAGSSRRLDFVSCETECKCFCGATRGLTKIDGYHMCKKCKAEYNSESEPESSSDEEPCVSACSDSEDDGGPEVHVQPERPNNKGYLKCEMCNHWLPWLWDKKRSLCAKCSRARAIRDFLDNINS